VPSRDAGRYLCNYLCWRASESGVRLAAFVHVPKVARFARPVRQQARKRFTATGLARVGEKVLVALNAAVNRT
jgi:pyroglutamyl-peptidase